MDKNIPIVIYLPQHIHRK